MFLRSATMLPSCWVTVLFTVELIAGQTTMLAEESGSDQSVQAFSKTRDDGNGDEFDIAVEEFTGLLKSYFDLANPTRSVIERTPAEGINYNYNVFPQRKVGPIDSMKGILYRENTPVWLAYGDADRNKSVIYTKLKNNRVKEAINYWKSSGFKSYSAVVRESNDNFLDFIWNMWPYFSNAFSTQNQNVADGTEGRAEENNRPEGSLQVAHLSMLIMMDYAGKEWPTDTMDILRLIDERVLYALAFWNAVQVQLNHIQKPKVHLHIAGIVIARNKQATPYVLNNIKNDRLQMVKAYNEMLQYWRDQDDIIDTDFPLSGYHVVVTMTNSTPMVFGRLSQAEASIRLNCVPWGLDIDGLLMVDDLAFGGIQMAVRGIAQILGATVQSRSSEKKGSEEGCIMARNPKLIGRKWSKRTLEEIKNHIDSDGWCLRTPRRFQPSGKRSDAVVLPGDLLPMSEQCKIRGWKDGIVDSRRTTCERLYCKNRYSLMSHNTGFPLDGTKIDAEEMCLDGKLIDILSDK